MDLSEEFSDMKDNLLQKIQSILNEYSENTNENALKLNQELQRQIRCLQKQFQNLQKAVFMKYSANASQILARSQPCRGISYKGAWLRGCTFFYKGNLYFKDKRGRCGPNTDDYWQRINAGEMFPMDFNLRARHIWTLRDKSIIIKAVKTQLIEHLQLSKTSILKPQEMSIAVHSLKLVELLARLNDTNKENEFEIDFHRISVNDLRNRHSKYACEAMWLQYLQPNINREAWTDEEDIQLLELVKQHNRQDWLSIASSMVRRSEYQCFIQYQTELSFISKKATTLNNNHIIAVVKENSINGVINWTAVMAQFPDVRKSTIVGRYFYQLKPEISREKFSPEEDLLLIAAAEEYNGKFHSIPKHLFPNRSLTQLRSRYRNTILMRGKVNSWTVEDDKNLMEFVATYGVSSWSQCAEHLKNHTRQSCRTRFYTIKRHFEKNPNATIDELPCRRARVFKNDVNTENWTEKLSAIMDEQDEFNCDDKPPKMKLPKRPYLNRLRPVQLELYNFFKYSYNFRLGKDVTTEWPQNNNGLKVVAGSLRLTHCMTDCNYKFDKNLPMPLRFIYDDMMARLPSESCVEPYLKLPMNWCTAMGFRALCIQAAQPPKKKIREPPKNEALLKFRQRLRALFYNTILFSRLEPKTIPGLNDAMKSIVLPKVSKEPREYPALELTKVRIYEPKHHVDRTASTTTRTSATTIRNGSVKSDNTNDVSLMEVE